MKRIGKGLIAIVCACAAVFSFASCQKADSAYDVAVENGFQGSEWEWLLSLRGVDGEDGKDLDIEDIYQKAKEDGYQGTYLEFLQEYLSIDVKENNDTVQIAQNIMSVVNINCGFSYLVSTGIMGYGQTYEYDGAAGSGVVLDLNKETGDALIVTNYHVVYDANSVEGISENIYLYAHGALNMFDVQKGDLGTDGVYAEYVGGAMDYDIALLRVRGSEYLKNSAVCEAVLGNSEDVTAGEKVYAIGNAQGRGISVTNGVISVESENIVMQATDGKGIVTYRVMRTDAAINAGNSGGGLFNAKGELVGIVNAKTTGSSTDNMGFALPITQVNNLLDNLSANLTQIRVATLGSAIDVKSSEAQFDEDGHIEIVETLYVKTPAKGYTSADKGLFKTFDILVSMQIGEGEVYTLTREYMLYDLLLEVRQGDTVHFVVKRDGITEEVTVSVKFDQDKYFKVYR